MTDFQSLNLAAPVAKALAAEGYETPTPIQAQAIPAVLEGRDVLGVAQTGTGKTAAFALPILDHLARNRGEPEHRAARALVLAPTRELAAQIADSVRKYGVFLAVRVEAVFGGVPAHKQARKLKNGVDVLVATPGRLLDLVAQDAIRLDGVEVLVLDEADQMMDLGFIHPLKKIVRMLPKDRQTMFFSATMPKAIEELADQFVRDPVRVSVAPESTTAERVDQSVIFTPQKLKSAILAHKLTELPIDRAIVFTRTKHGADRVVRQLAKEGIESAAIHGNKSQGQRQRALNAFKQGSTQILVATDIAARGIDVSGVSHVFNFELPNIPEQYVHRIGRTARAGADGVAISLCANDERAYLKSIERATRQRIQAEPIPKGLEALPFIEDEPEEVTDRPRGRPGGRAGGRDGARSGGRPGGRNGARPGGNRPRAEGRPNDDRPRREARAERSFDGDRDNHQERREPKAEWSPVDRADNVDRPERDDRRADGAKHRGPRKDRPFERRDRQSAEGGERRDGARRNGPRQDTRSDDRRPGRPAERHARQDGDASDNRDRPFRKGPRADARPARNERPAGGRGDRTDGPREDGRPARKNGSSYGRGKPNGEARTEGPGGKKPHRKGQNRRNPTDGAGRPPRRSGAPSGRKAGGRNPSGPSA